MEEKEVTAFEIKAMLNGFGDDTLSPTEFKEIAKKMHPMLAIGLSIVVKDLRDLSDATAIVGMSQPEQKEYMAKQLEFITKGICILLRGSRDDHIKARQNIEKARKLTREP